MQFFLVGDNAVWIFFWSRVMFEVSYQRLLHPDKCPTARMICVTVLRFEDKPEYKDIWFVLTIEGFCGRLQTRDQGI